jgi:hypothetical protein
MQRVEEMARARIGQMINDGLGFPAPFDHPGLAQRGELLGKRRPANAELLLDFAHPFRVDDEGCADRGAGVRARMQLASETT